VRGVGLSHEVEFAHAKSPYYGLLPGLRIPGRRRPGPNRASNNAETADEDFVDGLDAGVLELGSFCRNGVYPDAAAATDWKASAARSSSALGGPRMICLKLGGRAAGHEPDGESLGLITIDGQRGRINSCSIIPGQRPRCRCKPGEHERAWDALTEVLGTRPCRATRRANDADLVCPAGHRAGLWAPDRRYWPSPA
jgi:hypothetical protein